jgi:hypothetical protein
VAYLFFASGVNNFGKLPILKQDVMDVGSFDSSMTFRDKITILGFPGKEVETKKGNAFNLNQKIYKRFYEFDDFQLVMVMPEGTGDQVTDLKKELGGFTDISKWKFAFAKEDKIRSLFNSLGTDLALDGNLGTPYVFIIDKMGNLRGRDKDEEEQVKFGFNTSSVADLNNKMVDDVKIILAEYRLALKKNTSSREK